MASVVVDKNYLEAPELERFLTENSANRAILHDFSAIEAHVGNPIKNLVKSMSILARYPYRVFVLRSARDLIAMGEILPHHRFSMVDWEQTREFPQYCDDLARAAAGDPERMAAVEKHAAAATEHLQKMLDITAHTTEFIETLGKATPPEALDARRNKDGLSIPTNAAWALLESIYIIADAFARRASGASLPKVPARASHHYVFRFAIAMRIYALRWAEHGGGLKEIKPERMRNDLVDLMYVTCATYWDDFLTKEGKMADIYGETRYLAEEIFAKMN